MKNQISCQVSKNENQQAQPQNFQRNKVNQPYRSYFYRNHKQTADPSPCQSSQTNKMSRTKNRLKSTRIKTNTQECLYYELESTKKNQFQVLKQENWELKKIIAELKVAQLYQIDEKKVRALIQELDAAKQQLKNIKKLNQKLRIQNDFLARANFQLKIQINKSKNKQDTKEQISAIHKQIHSIAKLQAESVRLAQNYTNLQLPDHLFLNRQKINEQVQKQRNRQMKKSSTGYEKQIQMLGKIKRQKQFQLYRVKSSKGLSPSRFHTDRKLNIRKGNTIQLDNNVDPIQ